MNGEISGLELDEHKRILCMRRADNGEWDLPGGYLNLGEQPAEALVREVFEETGLKVKPERLLGVFGCLPVKYPNGDEVELVLTLFSCRIVGGELRARDGEALELRFFEQHSLPSSQLFSRIPVNYRKLLSEAAVDFVWRENWLDTL